MIRSFARCSGWFLAALVVCAALPHFAVAAPAHALAAPHLHVLAAGTLFNWLDKEVNLTDAALTVRAQAVAALDPGAILSPAFFPRVDARSVRLRDITTLIARPVSDRREWNAPGRQIPLKVPSFRDVEMLPVEGYFKMEEQEMQRLIEGAAGNEAVFRSIVGPEIPVRTDGLVVANMRRIDLDAFRAWGTGIVTVRNPQGSGADKVVDFQFDSSRYVTPSAWTATPSTGTAFSEFMVETYNAQNLIGSLRGAVMRLSTYQAMQNTAPLRVGQAYPLSRAELEAILSAEFGGPFSLIVFEDTVEVFNDGGQEYTSTKIWPAQTVAWIPASGIIGSTYYAPVVSAYGLAAANPGMEIDVNGMTVVKTISNEGKELGVRCQVNALAVPNEQALYVVNAGV